MMRINDFKIGTKLMGVLIIPMLGLVYFSVSNVIEKASLATEMRRLTLLVELSTRIGNTVHELQKERGRTNLFLASGATSLPAELRAQREATDAMITELRNAFDEIDASAQGANLKIAADKVLTQVNLLTDYRKKVDDLQVTDAESFAYYTEAITSLLDTTSQEVVAISGDREISRLALAYLMLLQSKELAGRERALSPAPRASDEASTPLSAGRVKAWQPIAKGRGFDSLGDGQGDGSRAS